MFLNNLAISFLILVKSLKFPFLHLEFFAFLSAFLEKILQVSLSQAKDFSGLLRFFFISSRKFRFLGNFKCKVWRPKENDKSLALFITSFASLPPATCTTLKSDIHFTFSDLCCFTDAI